MTDANDTPSNGESAGNGAAELPEIRTVALVILAFLAIAFTLHVAREFFLPIILAVLFDFILSPAIRFLGRFRLSEPVAAAVIILLLVGALVAGIYTLSDPVQKWLTKAPQSLSEARGKLKKLTRPVEQVNRAAEQVENATQTPGSGSQQEVVVRGPGLGERIFGTTQSLILGLFEVLVLLYFLLAAGDLFLQKLVRVLPALKDKKKAVSIAREAESSVSAYLGTVTLINAGQGGIVALAMLAVGMPNPILWGAAAGLLEFIPYLGAATMTVILTVAALVTFDDVGRALLVPGVYIVIDVIQANVLSPILLGRRLTLNPVAIFVGLLFWTLIWGVGGAFLAVPLLATMKIFCDHIERLRPVGEFLGR